MWRNNYRACKVSWWCCALMKLCYCYHMNPFTGNLNKTCFLVWSVPIIASLVSFGLLIDATKVHYAREYWPPFRILWGITLIGFSVLVLVCRFQNVAVSVWLVLLTLIPTAGPILWFVLFLYPQSRTVITLRHKLASNQPHQLAQII